MCLFSRPVAGRKSETKNWSFIGLALHRYHTFFYLLIYISSTHSVSYQSWNCYSMFIHFDHWSTVTTSVTTTVTSLLQISRVTVNHFSPPHHSTLSPIESSSAHSIDDTKPLPSYPPKPLPLATLVSLHSDILYCIFFLIALVLQGISLFRSFSTLSVMLCLTANITSISPTFLIFFKIIFLSPELSCSDLDTPHPTFLGTSDIVDYIVTDHNCLKKRERKGNEGGRLVMFVVTELLRQHDICYGSKHGSYFQFITATYIKIKKGKYISLIFM